jgi:hypothetical protein
MVSWMASCDVTIALVNFISAVFELWTFIYCLGVHLDFHMALKTGDAGRNGKTDW